MSVWQTVKGWFGGSATRQSRGEQSPFPTGNVIKTAKIVTEDSALQVSAVWACVRLLSETVASLPVNVFEKTEDGLIKANSELQSIIHDQPNSLMTSIEFREAMMLNLCLYGNAYAKIERTAGGRIVALWPLSANQVGVKSLSDGAIVYQYARDTDVAVIAKSNMLHIKLFGNGLIGLSPLAYARNAVGLSIAAEDYAHRFYLNGGKPGGVLTIDRSLTDGQRTQIRQSFSALTEGSENAHRLMVLEAGMKYEQVQINPEDMQMIQTRRFQLEDIARFFGVPSFLINDTEKTTTWGSGIEQMMIGFYQLNLKPYLTRWEQAMTRALLSPSERLKYTIEFNFEGLLRGDSAGRAAYLAHMVQNGLMTRNEARKLENRPKVKGGDDLTAQTNLAPLSQLGNPGGNHNAA